MESLCCLISGFTSRSRRLRGEDGRVEFLIVLQGGLGMFQLPLGYPRVFFSQIPFPSDQVHMC